MSGELTVRFHDARSPVEPYEWAQFVKSGTWHSFWNWPVVHAMPGAYPGNILAGTFHDGADVVGVVVGRLRGLNIGKPWVTVADLECPGSSALPGLMLKGGIPGLGLSAADLELQSAAVLALEDALRKEFHGRVQAVWYRQVYHEMLPVVQRGISLVYAGEPVTIFRNIFATFDDYLMSLKARRRTDSRRLIKIFDKDPNLTIEYDGAHNHVDFAAFATLVAETSKRNNTRRWPPLRFLPEPILKALLESPQTSTLRYIDSTGGLLACGLLYDHPTTPLPGQWGSAAVRTDGRRSGLWFDQTVRTMRHCIDGGCEWIIGGKGLSQQKAQFGFSPIPQWSVVRPLKNV